MLKNTRSKIVQAVALATLSLSAGAALAQPAGPLPSPAAPSIILPPPPVPPALYSYAVKYVCGLSRQQEPGEAPVKPGNYATEVNIFNHNRQRAPIQKAVLVLVDRGKPVGREPEQVRITGRDSIVLAGFNATMDDCNRLWEVLHKANPAAYPPVPPTPMPLLIGDLVLHSSQLLDVNAVYTAAVPGDPHAPGQGISIDVERVLPNRVAPTPGPLLPGPALEVVPQVGD